MFRELKLSITDEESHLNMRLDALLPDVMTSWLAGHPCKRDRLLYYMHSGGRQRGLRRRRSRSRISPLLVCPWSCL